MWHGLPTDGATLAAVVFALGSVAIGAVAVAYPKTIPHSSSPGDGAYLAEHCPDLSDVNECQIRVGLAQKTASEAGAVHGAITNVRAGAPERVLKVRQTGSFAVSNGTVFAMDVDPNDEAERADLVRAVVDGAPRKLVTMQRETSALMTSGDNLVWLTGSDPDQGVLAGAWRLPLTGGRPTKLGSPSTNLDAPAAIDGAAAYFVSRRPGSDVEELVRAPLAGGAPSELAALSHPFGTRAIAVDDRFVYWNEFGDIWKVPKAGGGAEHLATASDIFAIATDGTDVFFTDRGKSVSGVGSVGHMPANGGPIEWVASEQRLPWGLAVDEANVYWVSNADRVGGVYARPKSGGAAFAIAILQNAPVYVAVDVTYVYWSVAGDGEIRRAAKR